VVSGKDRIARTRDSRIFSWKTWRLPKEKNKEKQDEKLLHFIVP
jgi:hypothetical protein